MQFFVHHCACKLDPHPQDAYFRDRSSTTIFAALLLTADLSALGVIVEPNLRLDNLHNQEVRSVASFFFAFGAATALFCVFVSTCQALLVRRFGNSVLYSINTVENRMKWAQDPHLHALVSAWCTLIGFSALVYLFQGLDSVWFVMGPFVLVVR